MVASGAVPRQRKRSYTIAEKQEALERVNDGEARKDVCAAMNISKEALRDWMKRAGAITKFSGSLKRKSLGGQGRHEGIPFSHELVVFMKDLRRDEQVVSTHHIIGFMKANYPKWVENYMRDKKSDESAYNALMKLAQRFAERHGFSQRTPTFTKVPSADLVATRLSFATTFWKTYASYGPSEIINIDETAVYYDTPPTRMWAEKGKSARITKAQKHSARLTVVISVRADGTKLPLFFIVRGTPGGSIDTAELPTYPPGHAYAVQENAWMDDSVWEAFVVGVLARHVHGPTVVLLDNFESHVSDEGKRLVAEEACAAVCSLPPNATAACQPLDVGVMGPLKANLRALWLKELSPARTAAEKRLAMIKRTIAAFETITSETIKGSFAKAIPKPSDVLAELLADVPDVDRLVDPHVTD
ncbi:hypothetical protein P43SY_011835 [Pythium insidiosum]|uniref:DDE-1 domain-containing protein n=1 Tax=Pythium insidiosum TaxID=114742 RepID=A0AAD5LQM6_PYTIN|nr:hypothetical protein P43SY_011835 [Pythium insidiosum]